MKKSITDQFIEQYNTLKGVAFKDNKELAEVLGYRSANSITEITKGRQQIDGTRYAFFVKKYADYIENTESVTSLQRENEALRELVLAKEQAISDKEEIIKLLKEKLTVKSEPAENVKHNVIRAK